MTARRGFSLGLLAFVTAVALILIVVIVVIGPNTHANLGEPDPGFDRVPTGEIGVEEHLTTPLREDIREQWQIADGEERLARGRELYFYNACSTCHGSTGRGTTIAPALAGEVNAEDFLNTLRRPPQGMPPYYEDHISEEEAQAIFLFLESLAPADQSATTEGE